MRASDPFEIKRLGDSIYPVSPEWERMEMEVVEKILRVKYEQCPALRKALANSGDIELIEDPGNKKWGKDVNGVCRNKLGKLLMKIRGDKPVVSTSGNSTQTYNANTPNQQGWLNNAKYQSNSNDT